MKSTFILFAAVVCLSLISPVAQSRPPEVLSFEHLTRADGLSQSSGNAFLQDHEGYMWIGTHNGLNKYNSQEFIPYHHNPRDSSSLTGNNISVLYEDSHDNLWIGTSGAGLNRYLRDTDTFTGYQTDYVDHGSSISDNSITDILELENGELWIGTMAGLNYFDVENGDFYHFYADTDDPESLSHSHITALHEDRNQNFWIGTQNGLNYRDRTTGKFHHYTHDPEDNGSISHNHVTAIIEDREGILWIGTDGGGLNRFDPGTEEFTHYVVDETDVHSISEDRITTLLEDSKGMLWVGTAGSGLNAFDRQTERFTHYESDVNNPGSLSSNFIFSLYESNNAMLWVGVETGGINMLALEPPDFEHYHYQRHFENSLSENVVLSFLEDSRGNFFVGTGGGGLNVFDRNTRTFTAYGHGSSFSGSKPNTDVILALEEDDNGHLWFGFHFGGAARYEPESGRVVYYDHDPNDPHSISSDQVYDIYKDSRGVVWIGTNGGGVNRYDAENDRFIRLTGFADGNDATRTICEDSRGNLWVGSYGGGIRSIDRRTHEVVHHFYQGERGLKSHVVMAIHEDQQENLWVGTRGGGLHLLDRDSLYFTSWSLGDGLPSLDILDIREDDHGRLWLSTENGLSRFDPVQETFTNYNVEHGLQSPEFNSSAGYRDREGWMYFGGINGFNRFHPDSLRTNERPAPVVFTDFKLFNKSVPIGGESPLSRHISQTQTITLSHDASVLTFEYVALNFGLNRTGRYAYILEGFDSEWQEVGESRSATYTNLATGEYTFKVRTANSSGEWSDQTASVRLVIVPPFWRTTWFYLLVVMFVAGTIGFIYHLRMRAVTHRNKLLAQEVANRTSELYKKNRELKQALEDVNSMRTQLVEKAHKAGMADLASGVLHNMGNILNSMTTSVGVMRDTLMKSKYKDYKKVNGMLRENMDQIETFICENPKGKVLLEYYLKLEEPLDKEAEKLFQHNQRLEEKIKMIAGVVTAQQKFTGAEPIIEKLSLRQFVRDTLAIQAANLERENVQAETDLNNVDEVSVEKSKLAYVMLNLLTNAREAMEGLPADKKVITVTARQDEHYVYLEVTDRGKGLEKHELTRVFSHGYSTKTDDHDLGLHSSSNYMKEMGGAIRVYSEGKNRGATFTLVFPRNYGDGRKNRYAPPPLH